MSKIEISSTYQIIKLHEEIVSHARLSLVKAVEIGGLLVLEKKNLGHGGFGKYIQENLPFTPRTARNYMNLFNNRKLIKAETFSDLAEAYSFLRSSNKKAITTTTHEKPQTPKITESLFVWVEWLIKSQDYMAENLLKMPSDAVRAYLRTVKINRLHAVGHFQNVLELNLGSDKQKQLVSRFDSGITEFENVARKKLIDENVGVEWEKLSFDDVLNLWHEYLGLICLMYADIYPSDFRNLWKRKIVTGGIKK